MSAYVFRPALRGFALTTLPRVSQIHIYKKSRCKAHSLHRGAFRDRGDAPPLYGKVVRPSQTCFPCSRARKMAQPQPSARFPRFRSFSHTQCLSQFARLADMLRVKLPAHSRNLDASAHILCISLSSITQIGQDCKHFPAIPVRFQLRTLTIFCFRFCVFCPIICFQ